MVSSIGQTAKRTPISRFDKGLCPVEPTTAPMNAEAAMVSIKRAKPSFCSLENLMPDILTRQSNPLCRRHVAKRYGCLAFLPGQTDVGGDLVSRAKP